MDAWTKKAEKTTPDVALSETNWGAIEASFGEFLLCFSLNFFPPEMKTNRLHFAKCSQIELILKLFPYYTFCVLGKHPIMIQVTVNRHRAHPLIKASPFQLKRTQSSGCTQDSGTEALFFFFLSPPPNNRNAYKSFPSSLHPPTPFITQLSFGGLIRLYLVWGCWSENFWGSMWKQGGSLNPFGCRTLWTKSAAQ